MLNEGKKHLRKKREIRSGEELSGSEVTRDLLLSYPLNTIP